MALGMVQWIPGQGLFLFAMKVQRPGAERAETERKDDIFNQRFNDNYQGMPYLCDVPALLKIFYPNKYPNL